MQNQALDELLEPQRKLRTEAWLIWILINKAVMDIYSFEGFVKPRNLSGFTPDIQNKYV